MNKKKKHRITTLCVNCDYCFMPASLVYGDRVYGSAKYAYLLFWYCSSCQAWVGCHKGTNNPLGRLANKELRTLKLKGHDLFDPIWKQAWKLRRGSKSIHRGAAYKWLANSINISFEDCHFGMMSEEQLTIAIDFLEQFYESIKLRKSTQEGIPS
jgi:hypothetical protein